MKILFIAPRLPWPADTGAKIRTLNILKQLRKFAEVDLACFSFETDDHDHLSEFKPLGIRVFLIKPKPINVLQQIFHIIFHPQPFSGWKYFSTEMENTLRQLSYNNHYNAVHIDHIHMAHYKQCFPTLPCIIDEHNVEFRILERCAEVERFFLKRLAYITQAKKMKTFETFYVKKAAAVLAVSEDDKKLLETMPHEKDKIFTVFNGVDTGYFNAPFTWPEEDTIVFTGSMDWLPNSDAMLYFEKEILPLVWAKNKHVKLVIIGKSPTRAVLELANKDSRIVVTGRVDDVRPFIEKAKVFIVPIRIGGGTRLKILEAMSMRKAVVSTSVGAEGISYAQGKNILIADTPQQFADEILSLLENYSHCQELGEDARKLVCSTYDWNIVGEKLKNIYQRITHE